MAFERASGYNNLPNGVFSPTIYSRKVQMQFRRSSVVQDITNNDYFGEIRNFGDSVKIIKEPEITVSPYARGTQLTSQDLEDSDFTLVVDQANSFQFRIDDIETAHSHVNWLDMASDRAAYEMGKYFDREVLGYLSGYYLTDPSDESTWAARTTANGTKAESTADADELLSGHKLMRDSFASGGSSSDSIAVGVSGTFDATPLQILNRMNRKLDLYNVPKDGRWIVVDPVFVEILLDENSKLVNTDYNMGGGEGLKNGMLSTDKIRGFRVYSSNHLPYLGTGPGTADNNGSSSNYGIIVAGHDSAVATAEQLNEVEKFRDPNAFGDIVRGLHMYGRKILRPEGLIRAGYNINA